MKVCSSSKTLGVHLSKKNSLHTEHNHIISIHRKTTPCWIKCQIPQYFLGSKLNCIPHITYIIERSIEISRAYICCNLYPTRTLVVTGQSYQEYASHKSDPNYRLRLYCEWIGKTIVPGCIGSDCQPRFGIVLIGI